MILKADPTTVMNFVRDNFEVLSVLYRTQQKENLIPRATFEEVTRHKGDIVTRRLSAFKLIKPMGDDFRMSDELGGYLGFLLRDFKPLLPEQLRRYHTSIQDMFDLLITRKDMIDDIRKVRLEALYNEVLSFLDNVTNNTSTLLKRTQQLKVNRKQLTYVERVREARTLIELYIAPLNNIVRLEDANSIASLLQSIGQRINLDRMHTGWSPSVQERYELLNDLLRQVSDRLNFEGDVIRRELTPLLDRIKRESEVLGGFLLFLERPLLATVPDFGVRHAVRTFGDQTEADLKIYLEQFLVARKRSRIDLNAVNAAPQAVFTNRQEYRARLHAALPLEDFFAWCEGELAARPVEEREHLFFELINLLFGDAGNYELSFAEGLRSARVGLHHYRLPRLTVHLKNTAE